MKNLIPILIILSLVGCASYSELKPKPPIVGLEQGFIELKKDQKTFDLKKGKKYVVKFPRPDLPNFYIVLDVDNRESLNTYMTRQFKDGKGVITKMNDLSPAESQLHVFDTDTNAITYFWVMDTVRQDIALNLKYRYVPIWRYKIENHFSRLTASYTSSLDDRSIYTELGTSKKLEGTDYPKSIADLELRLANVSGVQRELKEIESVFPEDIRGSVDTAYQKYVKFSADVADELHFKADYLDVLRTFKVENANRKDPAGFVKNIPVFLTFFRQTNRHPANVVMEAKTVVGSNLPTIRTAYEDRLLAKADIAKITLELAQVESLYVATNGLVHEDFVRTANFIRLFNAQTATLDMVRSGLKKIRSDIATAKAWPADDFYESLKSTAQTLKLPVATDFGAYANHACVKLLVKEIASTQNDQNTLMAQLERSALLVREINLLKEQGDYGSIVRTLRKNKDLDFLTAQYRDLDDKLINLYDQRISSALSAKEYQTAETQLKSLSLEQDFVDATTATPRRNALVAKKETELWTAIDTDSRQRAQIFIDSNKAATDSIESRYASDVFKPVHDLQFTTGSVKDLTAKKATLNQRLQVLRNEEFPATAIELLYKEFTANQGPEGVARAHAIAAHGKFYKGKDRKILNLVAECDPRIAKWITKPTVYRKVFVVPVQNTSKAVNEYMFRLNVQIESEAQFPVFDINIKLPPEIVNQATKQQWYDEITVNGKVIKNEGRVTITAPSASNGYEMQISPVQMNKDKDNIVEVRFKQNGFKVFEISCMAQKPLIKKN